MTTKKMCDQCEEIIKTSDIYYELYFILACKTGDEDEPERIAVAGHYGKGEKHFCSKECLENFLLLAAEHFIPNIDSAKTMEKPNEESQVNFLRSNNISNNE